MEFIYTDNKVEHHYIKTQLEHLFPALKVFDWDFTDDATEGFDSDCESHIVFNTEFTEDKLEYRNKISIYRTPAKDEQQRALYIGKQLSSTLKIKTLVPYTHPDNPHDPYYDIIFDHGKTYLADDSDTSFADNSQGRVKVLEEYNLPDYRFDEWANLIG